MLLLYMRRPLQAHLEQAWLWESPLFPSTARPGTALGVKQDAVMEAYTMLFTVQCRELLWLIDMDAAWVTCSGQAGVSTIAEAEEGTRLAKQV